MKSRARQARGMASLIDVPDGRARWSPRIGLKRGLGDAYGGVGRVARSDNLTLGTRKFPPAARRGRLLRIIAGVSYVLKSDLEGLRTVRLALFSTSTL